MTNKIDVIKKSDVLKENASFAGLYKVIIDNSQQTAALFHKEGKADSLSYADYDRMARTYAAYITGVLPTGSEGGFIGLALDTSPEWIPVFFGILMAGYNVLLLDPASSDETITFLLNQAGSSYVVAQKRRTLPVNIRLIMAEDLFNATVREFTPRFADMIALCTSGTTGKSRIFVYNGMAICNQIQNAVVIHNRNKRLISANHQKLLAFLPFHHILGLVVCVFFSSFLGYQNVYIPDRAPQTILAYAQEYQINMLVSVPLLANSLAASLDKKLKGDKLYKRIMFACMKSLSLGIQRIAPDFGLKFARDVLFKSVVSQILGTGVDCVILGGSHTPKKNLKLLFALGYYTVCGFGMTETAITSLEMSMNISTCISGSVGMPFEGCEYKINDNGEMIVRANTLHVARFVDGIMLPPDIDEDGYFHTGDVVKLDKNRRMFVVGRVKDVIINESGENVYPDEIEELFASMPNVSQVCVLGIPKAGKSSPYNDITLVLNVGTNAKDTQIVDSLSALISKLNASLPVYKKVRKVFITDETLPTVNNIKVKRVTIREMLLKKNGSFTEITIRHKGNTAPDTDARSSEKQPDGVDTIRGTVREIFAVVLGVSPESIKDDAHFLEDLGGDSLQVLGIATQVEERFGILIPADDYSRCTTVNQMAELLYEELYDLRHAKKQLWEDAIPITHFEDTPELKAFLARQEATLHSGLENPYFVCHDSALKDVSIMDGHEVLNFGSYNYVGMSGRKEVAEAAKRAIDQYGTSASGSRLLAGEKPLYHQLEERLARWKHAESSVVLVGGHSTNVTLVGNFCNEKDLIVYDALAHNSIEQGCRLSKAVAKPFPHNDASALDRILSYQRKKFEKVLIIIEGAYSMDGDIADVPAFVSVKKKYGCFLMVDEAHSACVIGKTGGGVDEYFSLEPDDIDIKMGTLSKGLGTCGGYLAGSRLMIEYFKYNLPGFVFSVGISPPLAAATLEAINQLENNPSIMQNLSDNISCFIRQARLRHFNTCLAKETAIIPIMVGEDETAFYLSNKMRDKGVFVPPAVFPAVPKGKARLRFCVTSEHKPEQITKALDILAQVAADSGIILPPPDVY